MDNLHASVFPLIGPGCDGSVSIPTAIWAEELVPQVFEAVTWTLPEFYTSYIALISLIQWIFVALLGLVLTGAAALIAHYVSNPAIKL